MDESLTAGETLRLWRTRSKLSLREVAPLVHCTAQTLARIERHERKPTVKVALAIQTVAGIAIEAWVTDTAPQPAAPIGDDDARDETTPG